MSVKFRVKGATALPLLAGLFLLVGGCSKSLNLPAGPDAYRVMEPTPDQVSSVYRIGPGDRVAVNVFGFEDLSAGPLIVDPNGEVSLPLIGTMTVGGSTAKEFAAAVENRLRPRYVLDPHVAVNVMEYSSRVVTVEGQVVQPGVIALSGPTTLLEVIARSRGPTALAKLNEIAVFRTINGERLAAKFDLRAIRRGEAPDVVILGDDKVVVGFDRLEGAWRDFLQAVPAFSLFSRPLL